MADRLVPTGFNDMLEKWRDNGDGSYSRQTSTATASLGNSDLTPAKVDTAIVGDTTISTATASQTTKVYRVRINVAGATILTVKSAATVLEKIQFAGAGMLVYDFSTRPWYTSGVNEALAINNGSAVQLNAVFEFTKG